MRSNPLADPIGSAINQISNDNDGREKKKDIEIKIRRPIIPVQESGSLGIKFSGCS
jgi:hypothetical protein